MIPSKLLSLTSIPRKTAEQIILERFSKHVKEKVALGSCQHEFMKGKSCLINLIITSYDEMAIRIDEERVVDVV